MRFFSIILMSVCLCMHAQVKGDSIYAIGSLQHHIQTLINPSEEETIVFSHEDIAHLWESACSSPVAYQDTLAAYTCYIQAHQYASESENFKQLCEQSSFLLEKGWSSLTEQEREVSFVHLAKSVSKKSYLNFDDNPFLDPDMKERIKPHLISQKHSAKKCLDGIFKKENPISSIETFKIAGFTKVANHSSQCIVAKHPCLEHYLVKLYLFNVCPHKHQMQSWEALCTRCESAAGVRALIKKHKMRHFSVPDKWIYVLPTHILANAAPKEHLHPILLVVENMNLIGQRKSAEAWHSKITHRHLDELYCLLSHGYGSTKLPQNVPYTKHHKFALIDTEYPKRVFDYAKVKRFIPLELQVYWDELVRRGACPL